MHNFKTGKHAHRNNVIHIKQAVMQSKLNYI